MNNPILKLKPMANKKAILKLLLKLSFFSFGIYGMVCGYNNFTAYSVRTYHSFITNQAEKMGVVKTEAQIHYVVDPVQAAGIVKDAAQEGAAKGADQSIKANLGK